VRRARAALVCAVARRVAPSQILWSPSDAASSVVALRRCEPGLWFRYRCNSAGYPDEEFFEPQRDDYAVALLADSFGVGSVPWSYPFATLAERDLRERLAGRYARVAIDDRGIVAIDLPEYRAVFDAEVAGHASRQSVVCLFVGNDFGRGQPPPGGGWRNLVRLQGWLAPEVARRLWLVAR